MMFFRNFFRKPVQDQQTIPVSNESQEAEKSKDPTWVYIWRTSARGVGHVALQFGGSTPKKREEDEGEYVSIHPSSFPSAGLLAFMPLPAKLVTNLVHDMKIAAVPHSNRDESDFSQYINLQPPQELKDSPSHLPPDRIFRIEGLDQKKILNKLAQVKEGVNDATVNYELFPRLNFVNLFKSAPAFISYDPIDIEMYKRDESRRPQNESKNCVTLVDDILATGGMKIPFSKILPWGLTPNGLEKGIEREIAKKTEKRTDYRPR